MVSFSIQDPRDYFDSQQANALKALGDAGSGGKPVKSSVRSSDAYGSLRDIISDIRVMGLSEPIMNQEVAFKVFNLYIYPIFNYNVMQEWFCIMDSLYMKYNFFVIKHRF